MGEKEEDTEAKTQKAMKTTPGECRSSTEQARRGTGNPELEQARGTAAKSIEDTTDRSKQQRKENKPQESRMERQQRGETQKRASGGKTKENKRTQREKKETGEHRTTTRLRQES